MADAAIPVDLFNPGQVFACLGFLEAADLLLGNAQGGFDWSAGSHVLFWLRANSAQNPFLTVLDFLAEAEVSTLAPAGSTNTTIKSTIPTQPCSPESPYPFPDPPSPATLPAILSRKGSGDEADSPSLVFDHWGDTTNRDNVKFWAGASGYPGAALLRDALNSIRDTCRDAVSDPFSCQAAQSSSFRFDWRRDYISIDAGFSLNKHNDVTPTGFPLVEILAALGLTNARPLKVTKLEYRYSVITSEKSKFLDPVFLRAALGDSPLPFERRTFRMRLGWPGKEGQARCITTVTEERTT